MLELEGENLPQSIDPGDASADLNSDDIRVFATGTSLEALSEITLASSVLTPNGDRINDELDIAFSLLGVENTATEIGVYTLTGQRIRDLVRGKLNKGFYTEAMGRARRPRDALVPPGIYLLHIKVDADKEASEQFRLVSVAY